MYFLRKVHKDLHKIRPTVSCSSGPTERISGYLCQLLTPHLDNILSLVTNTQQVVQIIESLDLTPYPNITLMSLDVESLYLSIPQAIGIEMVLQWVLISTPAHSTLIPFKNFIWDLLKIVIDILMLWNGANSQLQSFLQYLNNQMMTINFTMSHSQESITFLDFELYKGHRFHKTEILDTKLFIKPTNPYNLLQYSSCHGHSTFLTIVKGETLRALRATSDSENYCIVVNKLLERFRVRRYSKEMLLRVADNITFNYRAYNLTPNGHYNQMSLYFQSVTTRPLTQEPSGQSWRTKKHHFVP